MSCSARLKTTALTPSGAGRGRRARKLPAMASPVKVVPASASDIAELGEWYRLAETEPQDLTGSIDGLARAHADGYLGYATGHGPKLNLRRMVSLDFTKWFHARLTLRTLSRNGKTIGMLPMGPPRTVWTELAERAEAAGAAEKDDQTTTTIDQLGALVHGLRHTYATELASSDVSVYTLMQLLGHESMTSSQRYVSAAGAETRSAAARNPIYEMIPTGG